ncbi:hypothetical protein B0H34DRAFT_9015 [Crassisporium funariophilum]|nr:hypothetical protein B0H34DRAFT_9015 [Crassisporium funariophilum]
MENGQLLCPVFCVSEIPTTLLDLFLNRNDEQAGDCPGTAHRIMDTKDLSTISSGSSAPIQPFTSPFLGQSVPEVRDWFDANITQPCQSGFLLHCFVVLDAQSIEDETCLFVSTLDGPLESLRCDFDFAMMNAVAIFMGDAMEGLKGSYMRSGTTMTVENYKLASSGGLYIEDGEVKLDQSWRDFLKW